MVSIKNLLGMKLHFLEEKEKLSMSWLVLFRWEMRDRLIWIEMRGCGKEQK